MLLPSIHYLSQISLHRKKNAIVIKQMEGMVLSLLHTPESWKKCKKKIYMLNVVARVLKGFKIVLRRRSRPFFAWRPSSFKGAAPAPPVDKQTKLVHC